MCCVFRPAFGCCAHAKAGQTTFFSRFQPFGFISNLFQFMSGDLTGLCLYILELVRNLQKLLSIFSIFSIKIFKSNITVLYVQQSRKLVKTGLVKIIKCQNNHVGLDSKNNKCFKNLILILLKIKLVFWKFRTFYKNKVLNITFRHKENREKMLTCTKKPINDCDNLKARNNN